MIPEVAIAVSAAGYIIYGRRRSGKIRVEHVVAGSPAATAAAGAGDGIEFSPGQRITRNRETRHFFLLGETGSGKSNIIARWQIEIIERRKARALILDPQGDITEKFPGSILGPWDSRSLIWDVAADVRTIAQTTALAEAIVPESKGSENPMWANSARIIFTAMCLKLIAVKNNTWTWADLAHEASQDLDTLQNTVKQYHPSGAPIVETASVTLSGIRTQLTAMMATLHLLALAWPARGDDRQRFSFVRWVLDPEHLPAHQRVLIVQMNGEHSKLTQFILQSAMRLVLSFVASPRLRAQDHDIWIIADEFAQAGAINDLRKLAEIARKKGVRVVFVAQSLTSLKATYGADEAFALLDAVGTRIICRSSGQTAEWASKLFGTKRVREMRLSQGESQSSGGQGSSSGESTNYAEHLEELPVIRVDEFQSLLGINNRSIISAAVHGFKQPAILTWPFLALPILRDPHAPARWTLPPDDDAPTLAPSAPPADGEQGQQGAGGGPALATDAPTAAPAAAPALPPWAAEQPQSTEKETTNQDRDLSAVLSPEEDR